MTVKTPVYLDNNSTTPLDARVLDAMLPTLREQFGNPASATHAYGWYAEELIKIAREQVAKVVNATTDDIVFTSGATEAINLALHGVIAQITTTKPLARPHVITAATEHRAALDPLLMLEARKEIELTILPVTNDGDLEADTLQSAFRPNTALVSIMLANNEIGTIHDVAKSCALAHAHQSLFHCDATQAVGKIPVDVAKLGADLISFSAHKLYGPKGAGALVVRGKKNIIQPLLFGGGHESGLRSGTLNVPAIVGFGAACKIVLEELAGDQAHVTKLAERFYNSLKEKLGDKMIVNGPVKNRLPGNLNLAFLPLENSTLIGKINSKIACSVSSACQSHDSTPSHVLRALGISEKQQRSSVRFGFGRMNTEEEADFAAEVILRALA